MKITCFILFISFSIFSQESIEANFISSIKLKVETPVAIDGFNTMYYISNNVFYKKDATKTISYNNLQLGNISSANTFNTLKINLFYKDFNSVIILDNRLAEIFKIDFSSMQPYRNVSHISTGNDNTLWLFNQDKQQLEVYDYKYNSTKFKTLPIKSNVLDIKSNYNYCWLLTVDNLLIYNYFGTLISKIANDGFTKMDESDENIILKKDNALFYLKKGTTQILPIKIPNLLINQFFVTNETLYIYNDETLQKFQLKTN
ncbi:hypothetical protein V8G69_05990 [Gaetbulibacter sp. M235]|uniref:hypothetical protein n=1 Tax=Gaetbulibacter sp. M235 TaxID=3126510 RepID=UPI00374EF644